MKRIIISVAIIIFLAAITSSCGLTPCDCVHAELNNDVKTKKKCEEKMNSMTQEQLVEWTKAQAKCIETN